MVEAEVVGVVAGEGLEVCHCASTCLVELNFHSFFVNMEGAMVWDLCVGNGIVAVDYGDGGWDNRGRGYGRGGWGRGRGRGFRGRGRGGYGGWNDYQQDNGYNNEAPVVNQGRGISLVLVPLK